MSETSLICISKGVFKAATHQDEQALRRYKLGDIMSCKTTKTRNGKFLGKFFTMLNVGFDAFNPSIEFKGDVIEKDFETFRSDVTILAGFYDATPRLDGTVKITAQSISFASMESDEEFEQVYSKVVDVILGRVLTNYTRDDLDSVVEKIIGFT